MMTKTLILLALPLYATAALAQHTGQERQEDVRRHRAIAAAHEAAARCLEAGRNEEACFADLQAACKGIAIGKYCGMRHEH